MTKKTDLGLSRNGKVLTPAQIERRAAYARLLASLDVPQRTFLAHAQPVKQQPGYGVFASA